MRWAEAAGLMAFLSALLALTAVSARPIGHPDTEGALAAALKREFEWFMKDDLYRRSDEPAEAITLCLGGESQFDIERLAMHLSDTVIRPVPYKSCRRVVEEGDFGMFTALYHYFGPDSEEASSLAVVAIKCPTTSSCVIDIDDFGGGYRHFVEQRGADWVVVETTTRWVV
ncbi:hypothetical protein K3172_10540 [Qipengyuania sp. 6B39]|uniref:hypothetical protein n=1 Tax=Qipengyuania proteolytica TaxID=2867239 RepID=UPI001C8A19BA|nr:hypothetical protein [Qipengyuania proteolytica]MBX7496291.1 hypothetical protein [Qipengyuania proteolytica]